MHLFLVRHGETEHNIAGLLAGVTDSQLTNHGVLQAERLASYLVKENDLRFTQAFSSDLQRAYITAGKICEAQKESDSTAPKIEPVKLSLLREQDFGSFELVPWASAKEFIDKRPDPFNPEFVPKETDEAMIIRAEQFLNDYIVPLLAVDELEESRVAVVSHGLFLRTLWRTLLSKFGPQSVSLAPSLALPIPGQPLQHQTAWTNTGYLELLITKEEESDHHVLLPTTNGPDENPNMPLILPAKMVVKTINGKDHLQNLKRTRGGVGSSKYDERQKKLDGFFKKPAEANS